MTAFRAEAQELLIFFDPDAGIFGRCRDDSGSARRRFGVGFTKCQLYEDAGDGYAYENGEFAVVPLHWNDSKRTLIIGARQGTFPTLVVEREYRIALPGGEQATVLYKGEAVEVKL